MLENKQRYLPFDTIGVGAESARHNAIVEKKSPRSLMELKYSATSTALTARLFIAKDARNSIESAIQLGFRYCEDFIVEDYFDGQRDRLLPRERIPVFAIYRELIENVQEFIAKMFAISVSEVEALFVDKLANSPDVSSIYQNMLQKEALAQTTGFQRGKGNREALKEMFLLRQDFRDNFVDLVINRYLAASPGEFNRHTDNGISDQSVEHFIGSVMNTVNMFRQLRLGYEDDIKEDPTQERSQVPGISEDDFEWARDRLAAALPQFYQNQYPGHSFNSEKWSEYVQRAKVLGFDLGVV